MENSQNGQVVLYFLVYSGVCIYYIVNSWKIESCHHQNSEMMDSLISSRDRLNPLQDSNANAHLNWSPEVSHPPKFPGRADWVTYVNTLLRSQPCCLGHSLRILHGYSMRSKLSYHTTCLWSGDRFQKVYLRAGSACSAVH